MTLRTLWDNKLILKEKQIMTFQTTA